MRIMACDFVTVDKVAVHRYVTPLTTGINALAAPAPVVRHCIMPGLLPAVLEQSQGSEVLVKKGAP